LALFLDLLETQLCQFCVTPIRLLRLLLERVDDINHRSDGGDSERSINTRGVAYPYFTNARSYLRKGLPVIRVPAVLDAVDLTTHILARSRWEIAEAVQAVAEKHNVLHCMPLISETGSLYKCLYKTTYN
jgi:hypothetical protein